MKDPKAAKPETTPEEEETVETESGEAASEGKDGGKRIGVEIGFEGGDITVDQDDSAGLIGDDLDEDEESSPNSERGRVAENADRCIFCLPG